MPTEKSRRRPSDAPPAARSNDEDLALPIDDTLEVIDWVSDALHHALKTRKGVAIVGEKGNGKTVAVQRAVTDFKRTEHARAAAGERRRVEVVRAPMAEVAVDVIAAIWRAVYGHPMELTGGSFEQSEDALMEYLVEMLLQDNVAALVFDESEYLSDVGLHVIRTIISTAEMRAKKRYAGNSIVPAGVGVVFIGTVDLGARLERSEEAGQRWVSISVIEGLNPTLAAGEYLKYLPGLTPHVESIGKGAWTKFVRKHVVPDGEVPIRSIENHVQLYLRRMLIAEPALKRREQVPFDEAMFMSTLRELVPRRD